MPSGFRAISCETEAIAPFRVLTMFMISQSEAACTVFDTGGGSSSLSNRGTNKISRSSYSSSSPGGGGGHSPYILVGVCRSTSKKGGLRHRHNPKRGVLGTGQARKKGVLGTGQVKKGGSLLRHIPVLDIYVSAPPPLRGLILPRSGQINRVHLVGQAGSLSSLGLLGKFPSPSSFGRVNHSLLYVVISQVAIIRYQVIILMCHSYILYCDIFS